MKKTDIINKFPPSLNRDILLMLYSIDQKLLFLIMQNRVSNEDFSKEFFEKLKKQLDIKEID